MESENEQLVCTQCVEQIRVFVLYPPPHVTEQLLQLDHTEQSVSQLFEQVDPQD